MTLHVQTAQYRHSGPDRLDVTRKGNDPVGRVFAPSWPLLKQALRQRDSTKQLRVDGYHLQADRIEGGAWEDYIKRYTAEMRVSYRRHRAEWEALLAREHVVLVCFCRGDDGRCHRFLLANILAKLGAVDEGEVEC